MGFVHSLHLPFIRAERLLLRGLVRVGQPRLDGIKQRMEQRGR